MKSRRRRIGMLLAGCFLLGGVFAFAPATPAPPPKPDRYVTDLAGAIPKGRAAALNEKLASFERETSDQVLVYVDRKVPDGTTLEEFTNRAFRAWGVGQKGKSNGVVFFLFTDGPRMRMEVGYGLEGAIPDARAHRINTEIIAPHLKRGDVAGALDAGTDALLAAARGEPYKGIGQTAAESRRQSSPYRALIPVGFLIAFLAAFFFGLRTVWRRARAVSGGRSRGAGGSSSDSSWFSSSSSSDFSSSSSDSSSSDFSGGGGDSGGGGSSDGGSSD